MIVSEYRSIEELSRTEWYMLQRAERTADGATVLLKTPRRQPAETFDVNCFTREFELLRDVSIPGVLPVTAFIRQDGFCGLVLRDPAGKALAEQLHLYRRDLNAFFGLAISLAGALADLHKRDLICRGLSPRAILINSAREVFVADLSLASETSGRSQVRLPSFLPRSLLPYISPEETGRMNRTTDYRTDFYSLGIILYEILTGAPPFKSEDPLELIHAHIARLPKPPAEVDREIPRPLSDLVMKLLAKTAEERYQSAQGIREDLQHCQHQWETQASISPFALGQRDVSDRFLIPQKLYGRDQEVVKVLQAFDRVCAGPAGMMLVAGYSGIGKTSLIQELYKPIASQRGYFTSGKFDQVGRNVPFAALIQAFRGLVQQLLTESKERLAVWRARLSQALGPNGGLLAEVIPEIELLIGRQPAPPVLGATEALNRFQLVFQNFVGALARQEHPLVVFLDDLQWADSATLSLLQPLLTSPDIQFLFLMGAYRDNEIDAGHPLARTLNTLDAAGASLHHVLLGPLELPELTQFVRDTLQSSLSEAEPLARLIIEKTSGNPFFVIQFLKTLKHDGFIEFDYKQGCWTYQLEAIRGAGMTDNVIDLMTGKIRRLSDESQRTLTLAACIGNPFDLETLVTVSQRTDNAVADCLREAMGEGLIVPEVLPYDHFGNQSPSPNASVSNSFNFLHDRVQQAAYALVPDAQKPMVHLTVGRLLLKRWNAGNAEEKIFDIVHHLNRGSTLLADEAEHLAVIRLNLTAGQRAKASTAYQPALGYLKEGLSLVTETLWESQHDLVFTLSLETAECKYLCGQFEDADRDFEHLLKRARTRLEKARVHALRLIEYENASRYVAALACGQEALALFGVSFPISSDEKQAALVVELARIQVLLAGRTIAALIDLPVMEDPEKRMVMKLLTLAWASAYISGDQILTRLFSATLVRLSLEFGNTEESAYGYATHTVTIGPISGDYASAYAWGELALQVNDRFNDQKGRAKIHQQFHAHANYWRRPFQDGVPHAREASRIGLETGDFAYAGYGAFTECWNTVLVTPHLDEFVRGCSASIALLEKLKMTGLIPPQKAIHNWARALQGLTRNSTSFSDASFDEDAFVQTYGDHPFLVIYRHILKAHLSVLFEQFEQAREAVRLARGMAHNLIGTIWPVYLDFFEGLTLIGSCLHADAAERQRLVPEVLRLQESLAVLAKNCPENFQCGALLLTAGLEGLRGNVSEAIDAYEQSIHYARETRSLHHEALACELFARFWRQRGNVEVSALYLNQARQRYLEWGAAAKASHLAGLLSSSPSGRISADNSAAGQGQASETVDGAAASLDLATVTKAARAIAVEIVLEELLRKLMSIALENAGAQRGIFLREVNGVLFTAAEADIDTINLLEPVPLEGSRSVSHAVIRYVQESGQSVVVDDATADKRFLSDPYIVNVKPKSILCVPVIHQGRFGGILYLENNLAANAFTSDRIEVMRVLSSQAAISLENARLYDEMKKEAAQRQDAEAILRSITEGTASVTGSDFFRSLVRYLATALKVRYAFVTACHREERMRAEMLAFWTGEGFGDNGSYDVEHTPCGKVLTGTICHYGKDLQTLFPEDRGLVTLGAHSFLGVPMFNASGVVIGHIAILDDKPMTNDSQRTSVLRIFAARGAAELERLRAEESLRTALGEVETLKNRLYAENIYLQEEIRREHNFEEIVGSSPALVALLRQVEQVAPTDSTVLIYGETGTGKELIARAIHDRSSRRERPLVKVNCGAISAGLVESELFGHVKGAFTGAIENRSGRFELADSGTLFLDEVGELPPETQVKLLRVLQEQEFEPVGSSRTVRVDVRIIAASNRNLADMVAAGRFRSDLFYRLNVFPLTVPPLRDRRSDIPQLAMFFLSRFGRKSAKQVDRVAQETMTLLMNYTWPGNIRELQNVIQRALVLSPGPALMLERDLFPTLDSAQPATVAAVASGTFHPAVSEIAGDPAKFNPPKTAPSSTLEDVERRHILEVLDQTRWVIEGRLGAAQVLKLHPNTLRSRMKKLGIHRASYTKA